MAGAISSWKEQIALLSGVPKRNRLPKSITRAPGNEFNSLLRWGSEKPGLRHIFTPFSTTGSPLALLFRRRETKLEPEQYFFWRRATAGLPDCFIAPHCERWTPFGRERALELEHRMEVAGRFRSSSSQGPTTAEKAFFTDGDSFAIGCARPLAVRVPSIVSPWRIGGRRGRANVRG